MRSLGKGDREEVHGRGGGDGEIENGSREEDDRGCRG